MERVMYGLLICLSALLVFMLGLMVVDTLGWWSLLAPPAVVAGVSALYGIGYLAELLGA